MSAVIGIKGFFRCVLRTRAGIILKDTGWFPNVITNSGMEFIRDQTSWFQWLELGQGSTAPAQTDTNLTSVLDGIRKTGSGAGEDWTSTYYYLRYKHTFAEGESTGNVRELALFRNSVGGNCFSHALIRDSGGNPITIVKGADKILDVYYEIRNYPKLTDTTGTINITHPPNDTPISYDYTVRAAEFADPGGSPVRWGVQGRETLVNTSSRYIAYTGGDLGPTNGVPTGTSLGSLFGDTGFEVSIIGSGNYYNDVQLQVGIDLWNHANGILAVRFVTGNCVWQIKYAQVTGGGAIPKTDEDRLRLNFRLSWVRL